MRKILLWSVILGLPLFLGLPGRALAEEGHEHKHEHEHGSGGEVTIKSTAWRGNSVSSSQEPVSTRAICTLRPNIWRSSGLSDSNSLRDLVRINSGTSRNSGACFRRALMRNCDSMETA